MTIWFVTKYTIVLNKGEEPFQDDVVTIDNFKIYAKDLPK